MLQFATVWSLALLLLTFLTLNCTPYRTLHSSADNCMFCIPNRRKQIQGLCFCWFLHLEQSPVLCVMCSNCVFLQVTAQDSPLFCLLFLTLPTVSSLPQVNCVCVCACVHAYMCVCVCVCVCKHVRMCIYIYIYIYICVSIMGGGADV